MNNPNLNGKGESHLKHFGILTVVAALLIIGLLGSNNVLATPKLKLPFSKSVTLQYVIGLPDAPPNITQSENTETVEMTGAGTISFNHPKLATGG